MSAQRTTGFGFGSMGGAIVAALALLATAGPAAAQWTHSGTASVGSRLGVGLQDPRRAVHLQSANAVFRMDRDSDSSAFMLVRTAAGDFDTVLKTWVVAATASGINTGTFAIADFGTQVGGVGIDRLRIDNLGDLWAVGSNLQLKVSATSPNGYTFISDHASTVLANTSEGLGQEAFLALNGDTAAIASPGGQGLLRIQNTGNYWTNYLFWTDAIEIGHMGDAWIHANKQGNGEELILATTGEGIDFFADSDANTGNAMSFRWYNNTRNNAGKLMDLASDGDFRVRGTISFGVAFDLAEAYWKSEDAIAAGDVVCIDPERPNAVVLARAANDRAVVGVVSTDPGIVMGLGLFNAGQLAEIWGEEVAAAFANEQKSLEKKLASADPYLKGRIAKRSGMKSALAKGGKPDEVARAKKAYEDDGREVAEALEDAALQAFCQAHFVRLSLAGRVPVKVDAAYGAIRIGDPLVASATPGRAMRSDNPAPCTVIGKALEPLAAGQGMIMMQVLNR